MKIAGKYIYNVVNVKFCSVNKFFFQVVWEFFLLHILALLFFRDLTLTLTWGEGGKLHTEVCVTVSVYVCQNPTCSPVGGCHGVCMCVKHLHIRGCVYDGEGVSSTYLRILPLVPISYYSITSSHKLSQ